MCLCSLQININLDQHLVPTGNFVIVQLADYVRGAYTKINTDKIAAEDNCRQLLQGASV